jgi:Zn-dependent protease with chaperone function
MWDIERPVQVSGNTRRTARLSVTAPFKAACAESYARLLLKPMNGNLAQQIVSSPQSWLAAILFSPILVTVWFRYRTSHANETERASRWLAYRAWNHIIELCGVAAWWTLWDFQSVGGSGSEQAIPPISAAPVSYSILMFCGVPTIAFFIVRFVAFDFDRSALGFRWTLSDLLRLSIWGTIYSTTSLLFAAGGFDALYRRSLLCVPWFVAAFALHWIGRTNLRVAQGLKPRPVKSGELFKRAFTLAKQTKIPLKVVCVVPAGRGHLTNAYGAAQVIAVTDNYSKFLKGDQLDFIIGHELDHARSRHFRNRMRIMAALFASLALTCVLLPPIFFPFHPMFDVALVFVPTLASCFISRRFEYAADEAGVALTNRKTAINALENLYRFTQAPIERSWLMEMFMTHPSLARRVRAIEEMSTKS